MSKNLFFKVLVGLLFVGVAVVWLLSAMEIIKVNLAWVIAAFAGGMGVVFLLKGTFEKNLGFIKKFNIIVAAAFFIGAVLALVGTFIESHLVLPIIAIIITVALLLTILVVGGKKWDQGDNQNAGYKNYHERKKEEEERNKK